MADRLRTRTAAGVLFFLVIAGSARAAGPDVIVGDMNLIFRWGRLGDITAYSFSTISCNVGDTPLLWDGDTNLHPVIVQNVFRLKDGRFEQIGMAWLKHGFSSTNESGLCAVCQNPGDSQLLGVGCNDPYGAGLNGNQFILGPRSEVNAATGAFPYPFTFTPANSILDKRIQIRDADIDPDLNVGARYFIEGHYVTPDDAAAGNDDNNASYRRFTVTEPNPNEYVCTLAAPTQRERPGIRAWKDFDPNVTLVNVDIPGDGRLILGVRVTDLGTGFWRYEYALHNLNSDRSVGSFSIPLDPGASVSSSGFHDIDYHSGEPYDSTDWPSSVAAGAITWATTPHNVNPDANALRWSTLYNFRLVTNAPPTPTSQITLGLFKPGSPASMVVSAPGPVDAPVDCNMNMIPDADEIQMNPSLDCDSNGNLDECDPDCDASGTADACEILLNPLLDCNSNGILDDCEIPVGSPAPGGPFFCTSGCDPDCNDNGIPDACDITSGFDGDCNSNMTPDSCDIAASPGIDCNSNGIIDACGETDCNSNSIPDDCEHPACPGILAGDMDCSGVVDAGDIPEFVQQVLSGWLSCQADMNLDGSVNGLDIQLFITAM